MLTVFVIIFFCNNNDRCTIIRASLFLRLKKSNFSLLKKFQTPSAIELKVQAAHEQVNKRRSQQQRENLSYTMRYKERQLTK
jgi:hypothetical protein